MIADQNFTVKYQHDSIIFNGKNFIEPLKKKKRRDISKEMHGVQNLLAFWEKNSEKAPIRLIKKKTINQDGEIKPVESSMRFKQRKKKAALFEGDPKPVNKKSKSRKNKDFKLKPKLNCMSFSQHLYSQSSVSGRSFTSVWSRALYYGPSENYKRKSIDYDEII